MLNKVRDSKVDIVIQAEHEIKQELLETFEFDSPQQYIRTRSKEFTAVCPATGLRDHGTLTLEYYPDGQRCVELKSLKYYLLSFQNVGIFQEAATSIIYADLQAVLKTERIKITLKYRVRGGFSTTCIEGKL